MIDTPSKSYCPRCGEPLPGDHAECPDCAARAKGNGFTPQVVLLASFVLLALLFVVTGFLARMYHSREHQLALQWTARGNAALQGGMPGQALDAFRSALVYSPSDRALQLRLAQALIDSNRVAEAQTYLLNLWQQFPGDGQVNLELARISARTGEVQDAVRYYQSAVYAVWRENSQQQRRQVRRELCRYLLEQGQVTQAQAELAGLVADTPVEDAEHRLELAELFLRASDPGHALEEFRLALQSAPRQPAALEGAGRAAFRIGDYRAAERYLARASQEGKLSSSGAALLGTAQQIQRSDPFLVGLTDAERARRALAAFRQALHRLQDCAARRGVPLGASPPQTELQKTYADALDLQKRMALRLLQRDPELLKQAMSEVLKIENTTARECSAPAGLDEALLLIGKKHLGGGEQ